MSKSMGFRNLGKLDLGAKGTEYAVAGALVVVIVAALVFVGTQIWSCDGGTDGGGGENRVKCVECKEEWVIQIEDAMVFNREMEMGGPPVGADCEKCGKTGCVFLMKRCPECKKYYLSKQITDPDAFVKGGRKEICPHCDTDLHQWFKDHPRRR